MNNLLVILFFLAYAFVKGRYLKQTDDSSQVRKSASKVKEPALKATKRSKRAQTSQIVTSERLDKHAAAKRKNNAQKCRKINQAQKLPTQMDSQIGNQDPLMRSSKIGSNDLKPTQENLQVANSLARRRQRSSQLKKAVALKEILDLPVSLRSK